MTVDSILLDRGCVRYVAVAATNRTHPAAGKAA